MPETGIFFAPHNALLLLADGTVFHGYGIGAPGNASGEICFNTAMTGYQEILTDPSYHGQIITFTFPHIGNTGTNPEDIESEHHGANGLIVREAVTVPSNWRSTAPLEEWLKRKGITGISGVDTRALTRKIRLNGPQNCLIAYRENPRDMPEAEKLLLELIRVPDLNGLELAHAVSSKSTHEWKRKRWEIGHGYRDADEAHYHVVAVDYGAKLNILRSLASYGCRVTIVPGTSSVADIMLHKPDGVFLSNGPGDPAATAKYAVPVIRELLKQKVPVFGICLGHQLLALAMGAETEKMYQGHRGANHPVKRLDGGRIEITSQNHGFVVRQDSLPDDVEVTHTSLFDGTVEGIRHKKLPAFAVQYHPESSPGPHDSRYLFEHFVHLMGEKHG